MPASCGRARSAYFSAEFGIHESLPIYSGGLGILAGDHIKSASDLGVPLVGVGLYYDQGYFRQRLDRDGWQHEDYIDVDHRSLPMAPALSHGVPLTVAVETRTGTIAARVWQLAVGRSTLLLLDSNVEGNQPEDRELTSRLYGGDDRVRIRQELLLGVGGVRALTALGISPGVLHLNEGHSAFAPLELVRQRMTIEGIDAWEALRRVAAQVVFTTHTPVPAGHDRFAPALVDEHLGPLRDSLGVDHERFLGARPRQPARPRRDLLHDGAGAQVVPPRQRGLVAARPGLARDVGAALPRSQRRPRADRPHHQRRPRPDLAGAADAAGLRPPPRPRLAAPRQRPRPLGWHRRHRRRRAVGDAPDAEGAADRHRARRRAAQQAERPRRAGRDVVAQTAPRPQLRRADDRLRAPLRHLQARDADAARHRGDRRARQQPDRCRSSSSSPASRTRTTARARRCCSRSPSSRATRASPASCVFVEDYDINVGRHLVQGVDVWINNPRRPLEACGTSGQKVVLNGGLNLSILDGWWAEAYDGLNGFAIGMGETHTSIDVHDARDGDALLAHAARRRHPAVLRPRSRRPAARLDRAR